MGTKYSSISVSSYNAAPPPDDGTHVDANKGKWSTIKTKLSDPLNTFCAAVNTAILAALDSSARSITGTDTAVASDHNRSLQCAGTFTLSLNDAATLGVGWYTTVKVLSGTVTIGRITGANTMDGVVANLTMKAGQSAIFSVNQAGNGFNCLSSNPLFYDTADPTKSLIFNLANIPTATQLSVIPGAGSLLPAGIGPLPYAGSSIPAGFLYCDGTAVSRTTYAALFTAIGTNWGIGNGSTTFNLPDMRGRTIIGDGTGTVVEDVAAASVSTGSDTFTVTSNSTKWNTGQAVQLTTTSGLPAPLATSTTYYLIRASATTVKFATTLANAQNGTAIDITTQGTGTHTLTGTFTARSLGEAGGEEAHAISSLEALLHEHGAGGHVHQETYAVGTTPTAAQIATSGGGNITTIVGGTAAGSVGPVALNTQATVLPGFGGNAALNIMQPFGVVKYIISY